MTGMPEPIDDRDFLEPIEEEIEEADRAIRIESKLYSYPADFTLEVLNEKIGKKEIVVPPFQRNYVWSKEKASMLIDSFLRRLPVPPVYLFATNEDNLLIVDGHQRLLTIRRFLEGTWENGEEFKLVLDQEHPFNEKRFEDLDSANQKRFKNSVMRAMVIEPKEGKYANAMYDIFQRLNTGGVLLMPQEIRNCVYHGELNDSFKNLNKIADWRKVIGEPEEDKRLRDIELVLRGIALSYVGQRVGSFDPLKYRPSMKEFLNNFMEEMQNPSKEWLSNVESLFTTTIRLILTALGENPFRVRVAMNAPTYDAVFVAFAKHLGKIPPDIKERYEWLKNENDFQLLTKDRPTSAKSVNGRIEIAQRVLFGR